MPSQSFSFTGSRQTWTVPDNVYEVTVRLDGAESGNGEAAGQVFGTFDTTPGETLYVYVGGSGGRPAGGWNGGGDGGSASSFGGTSATAWGGGGATDIRQGGDTLSDRVAAAGGGGGRGDASGSNAAAGNGAWGGGNYAADGEGATAGNSDAGGGAGGGQSAGGGGGDGGDADGASGALGVGGNGASDSATDLAAAGGGGGGGKYGGGGGGTTTYYSSAEAAAGGGGGGSNMTDGLTSVSRNWSGSSSGDGSVTIEWAAPPASPNNVQQNVEDDDTVTTTWDEDSSGGSITEYEVEIQTDGGGWTAETTTSGTSHTASISQSVNSVQLRVRAVGPGGTSNWIETTAETTNVSDLQIDADDATSIDLSWSDPVANDGTDVLLAESSGSAASDYSVDQSVSGSPATITGLENGERFFVRVQATYSGADQTPSPVSNEVVTTLPVPAPTINAIDASTKREITLSLTLPDNSTDGDVLAERSTDGGSTWSEAGTITDLSASTWTDTGLDDGTTYHYRLTRRTDHVEATSGTASATTVAPEPVLDELIVDGDVLEVTVTDAGNSELRHEIEVRRVDVVDDSWTQSGSDIAAQSGDGSTITGTTDSLLDGERYRARIRTVYPDATATSNRIARTTVLPDEDQPQLGNGVEDEIAVDRGSAVSDYGSVRIQIRETGESSWDSSAEGFAQFIGNYDTLSMEFVGLEDGEEYEIRSRVETEHVDGTWTSPVSIITQFPGATDFEIVATTETTATIRWQDNADNESGTEIWLREELDPWADTGYGDWELVETIPATDGTGVVEHTVDELQPNHDYELYVKPFTPHASSTTSIAGTTTGVLIPEEGWYVVIEADDGERVTVPERRMDRERPSIEPEKSAVGRWEFDIVPDERLRDWLRSEAYVYFDGGVWMRGPFTQYLPHGGSSAAAAKIRGLDHLQHLKSGGLAFEVQSEPGYEALQRFGDEQLPDWDVDITTPASTVVDEGLAVYTPETEGDYETAFGAPADTEPWAFTDGEPEPLVAAHHIDARFAGGSFSQTEDPQGGSDDYVDGAAVFLSSTSHTISETLPLPYTIPSDSVGLAVRQGSNDPPSATWKINGSDVDSISQSASGMPFGWWDVASGEFDGSGYTGSDLSGNVDIDIDVTARSSGENIAVDWIILYDKRYLDIDDFPDATDSNSQLPGPPAYPTVDIATEAFSQEYNITAAEISVNASSPLNRLQATNDGGTTWLPNDGSEEDTESVIADFGAAEIYGTEVEGRVTLGAEGSRTSDTPTEGFDPQTLTAFSLSIDTNALRVIDDQTYTGSPFSILTDIAGDSGMVLAGDAREDQLALEAFAPGDVVVDPDWTVEDDDPIDTTEGYYNSITVFGPEGDDGERLSATATSQSEVDAVGEVEGEAEFRPDATTEAELVSIARTLLAEGIAKDTVTGTLEIAPQLVQPGYAYRVDEFERFDERESPAYVLQRGSFSWGTISLDFEGRSLVTAIRSIETEVSTVKRAL